MELPPELLNLVVTYGYLAVFLGCLLEGDALLVVASFMAYLDKLSLPLVMLSAFLGTWTSDVMWFLLGRYSNSAVLEKWQWLHKLSNHSISLVGKRPRLMASSVRFMYGLRAIIPLSLGKTNMKTSTFLVYNALGVLIWVSVFSAIGYFFASLAETMFGKMKHLEIILPGLIVITLLSFIYASHIFEYILKLYPRNRR